MRSWAGPGTIEQRLGQVYKAAIDLYTAPPHRPGCMIVGTAAVRSPSHPKIAAVANELLAAIEKAWSAPLPRAICRQEALARGARAAWPAPSCTPSPSAPRLGAKAADLKAFRRLDGADDLRLKM